MFTVMCPSCNGLVRIKTEPRMGQYVTCPNCQKMTKVTSLHPIKLEVLNGNWNYTLPENSANQEKVSKRRQERFNRVDQDRLEEEDGEIEELYGGKKGKPGKRGHKGGKLRKSFDDDYGF